MHTAQRTPDAWSLTDALQESYRHITGLPVEHDVRRYFEPIDAIDRVGAVRLDDAELRARARGVRDRARNGAAPDDLLTDVFALVREAAARTLDLRPFDVQMAAAVALHQGRLAQLATGEGKTLVAVMPAILHALDGRGVHVFTANDYLARRDAEWMGPVYRTFGLNVAHVVQGMTHEARRQAYGADVTYVTAKEAGFDFLRDHTATDAAHVVHRGHRFAIVDEADCILIDEARVPLVIAGPSPLPPIDHVGLASLVRVLQPGVHYDADEYGRTVVLTETGFRYAGSRLGVHLDDPTHHLLLSAIHVALHAHALLRRDRDYVVRDGRVEIVDEWTGRVADNRRWPHGIQPAVEAKERVEVRSEGRILGSIPMQHFVREYASLAGMTATAEPSAEEFWTFFGLRTVAFPPNRPRRRVDDGDIVFTHKQAKLDALVGDIVRVHATGRPILVGTASVRESEQLAGALRARGLRPEVLNARQDADEASIVARAGRLGALTVSTNMAGRGTDIVLGGSDPVMHERVAGLGGLYVIGTNRHESRRIDDQLRGRAGRQGDPGSSRFFVSLEDDLIQRYGVMSLIPEARRPSPRQDAVADPVVAREIARAQRIIEGQNFDIRRTLWKYSAVVDDQRRIVYRWRQELLRDEADPAICAERAPEQYRKLVDAVGPNEVRRAEQRVTVAALDRGWADHLALIEDIREGIHLQRFGGREPITEFHRMIVDGFSTMMDGVHGESVRLFEQLQVRGGRIDVSGSELAGSSTTWTYLVNDNPFSTLGLSMMANRNIGAAAAGGFLAVLYWPVTLAVTVSLLIRRWLRRNRAAGG